MFCYEPYAIWADLCRLMARCPAPSAAAVGGRAKVEEAVSHLAPRPGRTAARAFRAAVETK
jgi:hypothetical protein